VSYRESAEQTADVRSRSRTILAALLKKGMTDVQKERAIHDWVVRNVAYGQSPGNISYTAYGALTEKKAVCEGYVLLMHRLLTDAGITSRIVEGKAGGGAHAWNLVKLDGRWYHLDATWDDPTPDRGDQVSYFYFNVTDSLLARDHVWKKESYPSAATDFRSLLSDKIASDPSGAKTDVYRALLADLGGVVTTDAAALQAKIQEAIDARRTTFVLTHDFGRQKVGTALDAIIGKLDLAGVRLRYSADSGSNGLATLTFSATYSAGK
jgi:hypothetical protein